MKTTMKNLMFAGMATATLAGPCYAGTWVGGGGEFNMYSQNPWFVQNTTTIKACVQIDPEHFHLPPYANTDANKYLQDVIHVAFKYWQDELAVGTRWFRRDKDDPTVGTRWSRRDKDAPTVGTQNLEYGPCADDTDLRFQFGTLSPAQQDAFRNRGQDPRKFVSLAVRTDYDRIHLKGKGFIYVTADSGPLQPINDTMMSQPWAQGEARLIKVLAHELGHVFGLQHSASWGGVADKFDLMASGFPAANVSSDSKGDVIIERSPIPQFFSVNHKGYQSNCFDAADWAAISSFLKLTSVPECLSINRTDGKLEFFQGGGPEDPVLVGSLDLDLSKMLLRDFSPAITLWLPPEQTVFPDLAGEPIQAVAARTTYVQTAVYHDARSTMTRRMLVTVGPGLFNGIYGLTDAGEMLDLLMPNAVDADGKSGPVIRFAK